MSRRLVDKNWASRNLYLEKGELLLLLEEPIKPLVTARTRHGRNIRVPLSILTREAVEFYCQLCPAPSFPNYATYTAHLIEAHFRHQLLTGLDNTGGRGGLPSCPFPTCSGTLWSSIEALLMHYASHHHVLEKLMMFESEQQCVKYRNMITELEYEMKRIKEKMENLKEKMEDQKEKIEDQQDQMEEQKENEMRREEEMKREEDLRREKEKSIRLIEKMETDPNPVLIIVKEDEEEEEEEEKEQTTAQDARTIIKMETAAVTNIENQTLKMEFLQLKMEKEKLEQMLETRTLELEQLRADSKEMAKDQKKTVDMCKEWKEVCLAEEEKHKNEIKELKERISGQGKEIQNLKNIIEIGKSTVEHAKQLSTDLAKDNKKRQLKAAEYEMHCKKYQDHIQKLEQEKDANLKEIENLSEIVRFQHDSIETRTNENIQLYEDYKEMTNKYESLLEGIKGKDAEISTLRTEVEIGKSLSKENTDQLEESLKKALADKQVAEMKSRNEAENLCRNIREKGDQLKQVQDGLNKVTKELEEKKRELRSLTTELKDSKEKKEFYLAQCSELERSEKAIKQELEKLRKVVDGQKITKNQMENIQRKYDQDRDTMIADIQKYKDSRDHFEAQTTILLTDMDHLKSKLQKVEKMEEEKKEIIKELELANRSKNNLINQLQEESRQNKMKLDKFEDISNMFNSKSRNEEELRRKCEKMSAELKVQGWEIENYKNKLISFEMIVADLKELESSKSGLETQQYCYPSINISSFMSNNNTGCGADKDSITEEYCEYPPPKDGIEIKQESLSPEEEKNVTPNQRDLSKREGSSLLDSPDPKRKKH